MHTRPHDSRPMKRQPRHTSGTHAHQIKHQAGTRQDRQHMPPADTGPECQHRNPAKSKRPRPSITQARDIPHATHTRPDLFARASARKVLRARYFIFAGCCAQNFCRFGAKKPLPQAMGCVLEGGQKSDKGRIWVAVIYNNPPELHGRQPWGMCKKLFFRILDCKPGGVQRRCRKSLAAW